MEIIMWIATETKTYISTSPGATISVQKKRKLQKKLNNKKTFLKILKIEVEKRGWERK